MQRSFRTLRRLRCLPTDSDRHGLARRLPVCRRLRCLPSATGRHRPSRRPPFCRRFRCLPSATGHHDCGAICRSAGRRTTRRSRPHERPVRMGTAPPLDVFQPEFRSSARPQPSCSCTGYTQGTLGEWDICCSRQCTGTGKRGGHLAHMGKRAFAFRHCSLWELFGSHRCSRRCSPW